MAAQVASVGVVRAQPLASRRSFALERRAGRARVIVARGTQFFQLGGRKEAEDEREERRSGTQFFSGWRKGGGKEVEEEEKPTFFGTQRLRFGTKRGGVEPGNGAATGKGGALVRKESGTALGALPFGRGRRNDPKTVFVAGATGQIGARISQQLLHCGFNIRGGVKDIYFAQQLAEFATQYGVITREEAKRLNALEFDFQDVDSVAKAIGNASKVVVTVGPVEDGPRGQVSVDDALKVLEAAQMANVNHFVAVYESGAGSVADGPLAGISSFFSNLFSRGAKDDTYLLDSLVETDLNYTFIRTPLTEGVDDYSPSTSNLVIAAEGVSDASGKVSKIQVASVVAAAFSNTTVSENKVVMVASDPYAPARPLEEFLSVIPMDGRRAVLQAERAEAEEQAAEKAARELAEAEARAAAEEARRAAQLAAQLEAEAKRLALEESRASALAAKAQKTLNPSLQDQSQQPQRRETASSSRVRSVTDSYTDDRGRIIKLWQDEKHGLVGAVLAPDSSMKVIAGDKIRNGLNPAETGNALLGRLAAASNQSWDLAYIEETGKIDVWPHLEAAGRHGYTVASSINPFKGKTLDQCGEMLRAKGFVLAHTNDENGGQRYKNPVTGRNAYLDPGGYSNAGAYEPPHVDMHYATPLWQRTVPALNRDGSFQRDQNGEIKYRQQNVQAKKFPLTPGHKDWADITSKARDAYANHERACGRDPFAQSPVPTMQKGGVEFALAPLSKLALQEHMRLLVPLGTDDEKLTLAEAHQIIQELFVGIYVCNEVPSLAMDPKPNKSVAVSVPAPYSGTLVGDILKEVDALGKGVMQGIVFPEHARRAFINDWEALLKIQPATGLPRDYGYEDTLAIYRAYGARELDPHLLRELDTANADLRMVASQIHPLQMNYTFVAKQNSIKQGGGTVLLDSDLVVSGSFQMSDSVGKALRKQLQVAFDKSADAIGSVLKRIPEAQRPLNLLNYIGFVTQMMMTMKKEELMPDLNALAAVPVVYEPEEEMPPFLKIRSQGDQSWYLHGASGLDFTKVPKASLSQQLKTQLKNASFAREGSTLRIGSAESLCVPMHVVTFDDDKQSPKWLYDMLTDYQSKQPSYAHVDFNKAPAAPDESVVGGGAGAGGIVGLLAGSGAAPFLAEGIFASEAACCWAGVGIAVGSGAIGALAAAGIGYAVYSRASSKYNAFWDKASKRPPARINPK